ncbi:hypothetical protein ACSBOX_02435 [Arthrobacter sp. KN11-1C]|uniref:hypothetical protein n=1 Tax=Arthrobacter sp. KN11-1C TaxID=3445774 RepID=UPI003F9F629F
MENPSSFEVTRKLSLWSKQLTREWLEDWIAAGDLGRAAFDAGWRAPVDQVVMAMGILAELFTFGLAANIASDTKNRQQNLDYQDICKAIFSPNLPTGVDQAASFSAFPETGRVVVLSPTDLGREVASLVDPDLDEIELPDRQPWIDRLAPSEHEDAVEIVMSRPGAVGRTVLRIGNGKVFGPEVFFKAAYDFGYEDPRDQAVVSFGTLSHLLTTKAITAGTLHDGMFISDARDLAHIYSDLANWWFTESASLMHDSRISYKPRIPRPTAPKNTAFALLTPSMH